MMLGMSKKQLRSLVFLENMIIGLFAIIVGITIGLVFSKFLLMVLASILAYESLAFYFPIKAILVTIVFFLLIFLGISALTPFIIRTSSIITLLKGSKKANREIKFSVFQSILALFLLAAGYFMAASSHLYDIHPALDRIVLLIEGFPCRAYFNNSVVIGTYFFFPS